jgi:hypothetical protein
MSEEQDEEQPYINPVKYPIKIDKNPKPAWQIASVKNQNNKPQESKSDTSYVDQDEEEQEDEEEEQSIEQNEVEDIDSNHSYYKNNLNRDKSNQNQETINKNQQKNPMSNIQSLQSLSNLQQFTFNAESNNSDSNRHIE